MNLKGIMLSERSQSQKVIYYTIPLIWHSQNNKIIETENRSMMFRVRRYNYKGAAWGSVGGDRTIQYPDCGGGYTNLYMVSNS